MFCMNCGQQMPEAAQWCSACGAQLNNVSPKAAPAGSSAAAPAVAPAVEATAPPSLSRHIGDEVKARSRDAWGGIRIFAKSPVAGLPQSYAMFEPDRAMQVGLAFALIYELAVVLGMYKLASGAAGLFGFGIPLPGTSNLLKIFLAGLIPFASLTGAGVLTRKIFRGTGVLAGDVYTAGASLLPFGVAMLAAAILGAANFEIIVVLLVFALSYTILMLYAGCSRIAGIPEAGAAPAVPILLIVSAWLTKVIVSALL